MTSSAASTLSGVASLSWYSSAPFDLQALDDEVKDAAIQGLVDLLANPLIGEELRYVHGLGDLAACRKLYIDVPTDKRNPGPPRYRIVYRLLPNSDQPTTVQVISLGPRADEIAYRRAVARLGRPPYRP